MIELTWFKIDLTDRIQFVSFIGIKATLNYE